VACKKPGFVGSTDRDVCPIRLFPEPELPRCAIRNLGYDADEGYSLDVYLSALLLSIIVWRSRNIRNSSERPLDLPSLFGIRIHDKRACMTPSAEEPPAVAGLVAIVIENIFESECPA
jgi:hypothetical protein